MSALAKLEIAATQASPRIDADPATGKISLDGDSYPENSFEFFNPLIEWIEHYLDQPTPALQLELRLVYMNTSSVKALMDILDILEASHGRGAQIALNWYYDPRNERVVEMVEEFKEDCSFPFNIVAEQ